jgi:hypothetical protein
VPEKPSEHVSFDYAVIRVVPRVDRAEFVNAGVIVYGRTVKFLDARVHVDESRIDALHPGIDMAEIRGHLQAICTVCKGEADSGPIGALPQHERWHWLVAPRSTIIQMSEVHSGLSNDLPAQLEHLMRVLVL